MTDVEGLLGRSILYRWGARLFVYPDDALIEDLCSGHTAEELSAAEAAVGADPELAEALDALRKTIGALDPRAPGLAEEYTFLFERDVHCPLYETSYRSEREIVLTHDLAEISGFYGAFGVQVSSLHPDRADHLSLELDFLSFLCAKEAYAVEQGWKGRAALTRKARLRFLQEHPAEWLPDFATRLTQHARLDFYPTAARFAQANVAAEAPTRDSIDQRSLPVRG